MSFPRLLRAYMDCVTRQRRPFPHEPSSTLLSDSGCSSRFHFFGRTLGDEENLGAIHLGLVLDDTLPCNSHAVQSGPKGGEACPFRVR